MKIPKSIFLFSLATPCLPISSTTLDSFSCHPSVFFWPSPITPSFDFFFQTFILPTQQSKTVYLQNIPHRNHLENLSIPFTRLRRSSILRTVLLINPGQTHNQMLKRKKAK